MIMDYYGLKMFLNSDFLQMKKWKKNIDKYLTTNQTIIKKNKNK